VNLQAWTLSDRKPEMLNEQVLTLTFLVPKEDYGKLSRDEAATTRLHDVISKIHARVVLTATCMPSKSLVSTSRIHHHERHLVQSVISTPEVLSSHNKQLLTPSVTRMGLTDIILLLYCQLQVRSLSDICLAT